jgi:hypothetical protein
MPSWKHLLCIASVAFLPAIRGPSPRATEPTVAKMRLDTERPRQPMDNAMPRAIVAEVLCVIAYAGLALAARRAP